MEPGMAFSWTAPSEEAFQNGYSCIAGVQSLVTHPSPAELVSSHAEELSMSWRISVLEGLRFSNQGGP